MPVDRDDYFTRAASNPVSPYTATPVPGAVYDSESGNWTLNGAPVSLTRPDGTVWSNSYVGGRNQTLTGGKWVTPQSGGGMFGGFFDGLNTSNLGSSITDTLGGFGQAVTDPEFLRGAAMTAAVVGGAYGLDQMLLANAAAGTAGAAGAAGATGGTAAGAAGFTGSGLTAASAGAGAGLQAGGGVGLLAPGASTIGTAAATTAAANSLAPALGATGLLAAGAGATGGAAAAGSLAPSLGTTAAGAGSMTLTDILKGAKDYAPLIGAVGGALASGDTKTTTSADKSPWGPAQAWMLANLARGQALQKQYADSPFSPFQKQAYNNQAQLGNQFRGMVNGMVPQMNAFRPYQRNPQAQTVTPYQFGQSNLGMTQNPFGA